MGSAEHIDINSLIEMLGRMARLDFAERIEVTINEDPLNVVAIGLNMLSEELEANMVKRSILEDINENLERFSYSVAHDISSPLNTAIGLTSVMQEALKEKKYEELAEYLNLLEKVHVRASTLVKGILDYSKVSYDEAQTNVVKLDALCGEIAEELAVTNDVRLEVSGAFAPVRYNEVALRQIVYNLFNNAVKHNNKSHCQLTVSQEETDLFYRITVADNGPGIEARQHAKIFDLFESLKQNDPGNYGIGLATVKKLIEQAGGEIWLESEPGAGTKFHFTILKR